jgi:hypothetical protein
MVTHDPNNKDQTTYKDDSNHPSASVACFDGKRNAQGAAGDCFTGVANISASPCSVVGPKAAQSAYSGSASASSTLLTGCKSFLAALPASALSR